jgi:EAL domain-containing protein (putative c-di-GMP-specific phosphodiesterase class I)
VTLTIDDYGTGFSSLSYLKTMPVDQIKIDKSFVIDMLEDEDYAVIVRSTIDLAHNLGMTVIAEGVCNADIWNLLEILRCDAAQGYFIARPMSAEALEQWLGGSLRAQAGQRA